MSDRVDADDHILDILDGRFGVGENGIVTSWVLVAAGLNPDGTKYVAVAADDDATSWGIEGLLRHGIRRSLDVVGADCDDDD